MNQAGWILMSASWVLIIGLSIYCFVKIFTKRNIR